MLRLQAVREYKRITVRSITGYVGAEVGGVDLTKLDEQSTGEIRQAFADHSVLVFPDQVLTVQDLEVFGASIGELLSNGSVNNSTGSEFVGQLVRDADHSPGERNVGDLWHSDFTHLEKPNYATALYAADIPDFGGDTMFAGLYAAYDALSPTLQQICEQLTVMHSASGLYAQKPLDDKVDERIRSEFSKEMPHPLVISHPITKRKSLFIAGPWAVRFAGMTKEESRPLLDYLLQHAQRPEFTLRCKWKYNQLILWDNLAALHFAVQDYAGMRRALYRFAVAGYQLQPANPAALL
jgi:taurine dioxygenase